MDFGIFNFVVIIFLLLLWMSVFSILWLFFLDVGLDFGIFSFVVIIFYIFSMAMLFHFFLSYYLFFVVVFPPGLMD